MEPNPNSAVAASPSISRVVWKLADGPGSDQAALDAGARGQPASEVIRRALAQVTGGR